MARVVAAAAAALAAWPALAAAAATEKVPAIEGTRLPEANAGGGSTSAPGMGDTMLRMGVGLVVVVGLVLAVWYGMKRLRRAGMPGMGATRRDLVDVVSTTAIGPARYLHLVRVGGELILVGATDHSITPVARLTPDEAADLLGEHGGVDDLQAAFEAGPAARPARDPEGGDASPLVDRLRSMTARR